MHLSVSASRLKVRPYLAMNFPWLTSWSALTPSTTQSRASYSSFRSRNLATRDDVHNGERERVSQRERERERERERNKGMRFVRGGTL